MSAARYITISEDMEVLLWNEWQDSWSAEYEAGIIDILCPDNCMMYLGEADWGPIPVRPEQKP